MQAGTHPMRRLLIAVAALCATATPGTADTVRYFHLDGLGSIRAITNQAGTVIERHDYLPFGEECTTGPCASNPGVGAGQPRKFTGKERDAETGLDYFGARYYGSRIARFTTVDPVYTIQENLVDPQQWNRYAYGRNNPLRFVDPDGRAVVQMSIPPPPQSSSYFIHALYQLSMDFLYLSPPVGALSVRGPGVRGVARFQTGTFRGLKRSSLAHDGLDIDHQPSKAARLKAAEEAKGAPLTPAEAKAVIDEGTAVAVPNQVHKAGPTYGGKNTPAHVAADKADLSAAAARDADAMVGNAAPEDRAAARRAAERIKNENQ